MAESHGAYDLRVEADGYETADILGVVFLSDRATPLDVHLTRKPK